MRTEDKAIWYKNHYVWMVICFPLTAVIAGIITIRLAVISDDGLVTDDYYKKGLEINRVLERDRAATDLGLKASINLDQETAHTRVLLTGNAQFEAPQTLQVKFLNATRKGFDQTVELSLMNGNTYQGELPELPIGNWYVQIEADNWRLLESISTP